MISKAKRIITRCYKKLRTKKLVKNEFKKVNEPARLNIQNHVTLTKEQKKEIDLFFMENLGRKIPYNWHKEYYSISGKFDYRYFPEFLFIPYFESIMNNEYYWHCLSDKNVIDIVCNSCDFVRTPRVVCKMNNGILFDSNYNIIDRTELFELLKRENEVFIKPTVDTCSGFGCKVIDRCDLFNEAELNLLLDSYGKDFVIQEVVKCSTELASLNQTSVNTFRIITYYLDGKIYHMPIILRIGRNGNRLDNAHQGGIFIGVHDDGSLLAEAHSEFGEMFEAHPDSGVKFSGYTISGVSKIIDAAHKLQAMLPRVGCINWDFTLDKDINPVLIEANMRGGSIWLIQMAHGISGFGENTSAVLRFIRRMSE